MTKRSTAFDTAWLVAAIALLFPADAWAYLDPGTGSLFIQSLIALLAAAGYGVRVYWSRIRGWFRPADRKAPAQSKDFSEPT